MRTDTCCDRPIRSWVLLASSANCRSAYLWFYRIRVMGCEQDEVWKSLPPCRMSLLRLDFKNNDWLNIWPSHSGMNEMLMSHHFSVHCICYFTPHPRSVLATWLSVQCELHVNWKAQSCKKKQTNTSFSKCVWKPIYLNNIDNSRCLHCSVVLVDSNFN